MPELGDIIGQDGALARIQRGLSSARVPQALLFVGPDGVGRRTAAVALAKTVLCRKPRRRGNAGRLAELPADFSLRSACGGCASCRALEAGTHADFHLVYKELARYHEDPKVRDRVMQELGIDVIRDFLIAPAGRRSAAGTGKVFVVLEAELMSAEAQNSLLKTLEEPPPGVTIILISETAEELLPTTLSRCWMVNFAPLPQAFVRERLAAAGVGKAEAEYWAAYTEGALGQALRLAEQGMYKVKRDLLAAVSAEGGEGMDLAGRLEKAAERLAAQLAAEVKQQEGAELSRLLATRRAAAVILGLLAGFFRDALTVATGADRPLVNADQAVCVRSLAGRFGTARLAGVIEQLSEYEGLLWRNVNPPLVWENAAITVSSAQPLRL